MKIKCPVCKTENDYFSWHEEVGLVEQHYYCENCGYFIEMVYSPTLEGMLIGYVNEEEELDKKNKREKYKDRIKELNLECHNLG